MSKHFIQHGVVNMVKPARNENNYKKTLQKKLKNINSNLS